MKPDVEKTNAEESVDPRLSPPKPAASTTPNPPPAVTKVEPTDAKAPDAKAVGSEVTKAADEIMARLQDAAKGLLFLSETDAPLVPFFWPEEKPANLTPDHLARLADIPAGTPIKTAKLDTFFRTATKEEDWHNDDEKAEVKRFQNLVQTIKDTLDGVKVFRVGETKIDVYIVGRVDGGYAGLKTNVVNAGP